MSVRNLKSISQINNSSSTDQLKLQQIALSESKSIKHKTQTEDLIENTHNSDLASSMKMLQTSKFPQDKYIFAQSPQKELALGLAVKQSEQQYLKQLEENKKVLDIYEQQRIQFVQSQNQAYQEKQVKLRENQNYLLQQILDKQQAQLEFRQNKKLQDDKFIQIQQQNKDLINIYPPIRETPKENRRFQEKKQQKQIYQEYEGMVQGKQNLEKQIVLAIKQEQHKIALQKKQEEDEEKMKRKSFQKEQNLKYVKDWKVQMKLKNQEIILEESHITDSDQDEIQVIDQENLVNTSQISLDQNDETNLGDIIVQEELHTLEQTKNVKNDNNEAIFNKTFQTAKTQNSLLDSKLLNKLDEANEKLNKQSNGKSSTKFKYDIDNLRASLQNGDPKAVLIILNSNDKQSKVFTPRHFMSQEKISPRKRKQFLSNLQSNDKLPQNDPVIELKSQKNLSINNEEDKLSIYGSQPSIFNKVEKDAIKRFLKDRIKEQKLLEKTKTVEQEEKSKFQKDQDFHKLKQLKAVEQLRLDNMNLMEQKRMKSLENIKVNRLERDFQFNEGYPRLKQDSKNDLINKKEIERQVLRSYYQLQIDIKEGELTQKKDQELKDVYKINQTAQQSLFKERETKLRKELLMKEILKQQQLDVERLQKLKLDYKINSKQQTQLPLISQRDLSQQEKINDQSVKLSQLITNRKLNNKFDENEGALILQKIPFKGSITSRDQKQVDGMSLVDYYKKQKEQIPVVDDQQCQSQNSQLFPWESREKSVQQMRTIESLSSRKSFRRNNLVSSQQNQNQLL
eukprot:403365340